MTTVQPKKPTKTKRRLPCTKVMCTRCGRGLHSYEQCPARMATCHRCNKKGYYSSRCFTKQVSEVSHSENVSLTLHSLTQFLPSRVPHGLKFQARHWSRGQHYIRGNLSATTKAKAQGFNKITLRTFSVTSQDIRTIQSNTHIQVQKSK